MINRYWKSLFYIISPLIFMQDVINFVNVAMLPVEPKWQIKVVVSQEQWLSTFFRSRAKFSNSKSRRAATK